MAGRTSVDRPEDSSNGTIERQQESIHPAAGKPEDDQTLADRDQTLADADQTGSDSDQTAADGDQAAADSDQAASDRDLADGGDPGVHEVTRDLRDHSAQQRGQTSQTRVDAAASRDVVAHARDRAASARDRAAALRDRELATPDAPSPGDGRAAFLLRAAENLRRVAAARASAADSRARAATDREQAATDREQAAGDREQAATDREQGAHDRERAARDRKQAQADREALLDQLAIAETDTLTGTRTRASGLADLDHEIDRARRMAGLLVVAYVDVVGLKAVNDARGHAAGDALLRRAAHAIRADLRSYDTIVRLGGDEFLCVMSGATIQDARQRFDAVQTTLARGPDPSEITVGFAALAPGDGAAELIERADAELPTRRRR